MARLCVFCGSAIGRQPRYLEAAVHLGRTLAEGGHGVVYGGASVGLMGALADSALAAGGEVVGVIPRSMIDRELAHEGLTALHVVETMHERKARMTELADGFLAIPGGHGTMDELFEALTWSQLGIHEKPIGLWNLGGYYDSLLAFLEHAGTEGFVRPHDRARLRASEHLEALLPALLPT